MSILDLSTLRGGEAEPFGGPIKWDNFKKETPALKAQRIRDAKRLHVPAVFFTSGQVQRRVRDMSILEHATNQVHGNIYTILLKGGAPFGMDYARQLRKRSSNMDNHPVVDYMKVSRFGDEQTGLDVITIDMPLSSKVLSKAVKVTLLDEVGDLGETVAQTRLFIRKQYEELTGDPDLTVGLRLASDKGLADYSAFGDDVHIGFRIPPPWGSGYGMDGKWKLYPDTAEEVILDEINRMDGEIFLSRVQKPEYREQMPAILDALGDRALTHNLDDFIWLPEAA